MRTSRRRTAHHHHYRSQSIQAEHRAVCVQNNTTQTIWHEIIELHTEIMMLNDRIKARELQRTQRIHVVGGNFHVHNRFAQSQIYSPRRFHAVNERSKSCKHTRDASNLPVRTTLLVFASCVHFCIAAPLHAVRLMSMPPWSVPAAVRHFPLC